MNDLFRFIGDTKNGMGYVYGKIYMLQLTGRGMTNLGVLIEAPIRCPYSSWETFFQNWERI